MLKRLRGLARLRANLGGWFWMNCSRCGIGFAGFEWTKPFYRQEISTGPHSGRCVYCPWCAKTRDGWDPGWQTKMATIKVPFTRERVK